MQDEYDLDNMERRTELPDLEPYSTVPRYNMLAVEKATGLSPRTLRSWERRYDVPAPQRAPGGHRLYSERDLALIRWLMEQVAGRPPDHGGRLLSVDALDLGVGVEDVARAILQHHADR